MSPKNASVARSVLGASLLAAAVGLMSGSASATTTFSCPATLDVGLSTTQTGFTPEWSSPRTMLAVVNAWVSSPGVLACGYGGAPDGSQVTQIYKLTTATCTANAAHTGFDCDRAP